MLPLTVKESLQERLTSMSSPSSKPTLVVLDPYMAQALAGLLGSDYKVQDLFSWASETLKLEKPNPINLLDFFDEALRAAKIKLLEESLPFRWRLAQLFAQDWQEILLSTSSLEEARRYWEQLPEHKHISSLFSLQSAPPPWLKLIPLPLKSPDNLKAFWEHFKEFLGAYLEALLRDKKFHFSEGALQTLKAEKRLNGVLFLHVYSAYPLLEGVAKEAPDRIDWDVTPLIQALPEVWTGYTLPRETHPFPAQKPRKVYLRTSFVLTDLLRSAAQQIAKWVKEAPEGACAAVWCHPASETLLRHFLSQEGLPPEQVSPPAPTLWESTKIGEFLRPYLAEGLEGRLRTWPEPSSLSEEEASAAERWARNLYQLVRRGEAHNPLHWNFLAQLFQDKAPDPAPFPSSVRVYIGQLTQLTGGCYDVLFLVDPPIEPLGPWARPSFWMTSLRKQFYSPAQHNRLAWRLQSVLLWASQEIWIFRLADPTRIPPIEELLVHREPLGLEKEFAEVKSDPPSGKVSVPVPRPIEEAPQGPLEVSLSPSRISSLFRCPRRFYWEATLPKEGPPKEALSIGRLMHELVRHIIAGKTSSPRPVEITLAKLAYRASRRRLLYRAARLLTPEERRLLRRTHSYRLLMPILAELGQPLLQALVELLQLNLNPGASRSLRWRHFRGVGTRHRFYVEYTLPPPPTSSQLPPLDARIDLLVETLSSSSSPQRFLLDFKQRLPRKETQPIKALQELSEVLQALQKREPFPPPSHYEEALFQVLSYAWYLHQVGLPVEKIGVVSLWWRPERKRLPTDKNPPEGPLRSFSLQPNEADLLQGLWENLSSFFLHSRSMSAANFPQTPDKQTCRYCDFALLCDRLQV